MRFFLTAATGFPRGAGTSPLSRTAGTRPCGGSGGGAVITQYTLTYETNGGSSIASTKHISGATVNLIAIPTREGFTFTGWYSDAGLTNKITSIKMNGNKTVYAGWEKESSPTPEFADVAPDAWYADAVDYVAENGLMNDVGNNMFDPQGTTTTLVPTGNATRAEAAAILMRFCENI